MRTYKKRAEFIYSRIGNNNKEEDIKFIEEELRKNNNELKNKILEQFLDIKRFKSINMYDHYEIMKIIQSIEI